MAVRAVFGSKGRRRIVSAASLLVLYLCVSLSFLVGKARATTPSSSSSPFKVVGYIPEYRTGLNFDEVVTKVTDLVLFSVEASSRGDLKYLDRLPPPEELERIRKNLETRTNLVVCIGGGGRSGGLAQALKYQASREKLIQSVAKLLGFKNLDGIDIDWESPSSEEDYENLYSFLRGLRAFLSNQHSISVAIHPGQEAMLSRHNIFEMVDWVSIMAYDNLCYYPKTQPPCLHSTLEFSNLVVSHAQSQVAEDQWHKLLLGIPFYGRHTHTGEAKTYYELLEMEEETGGVGDDGDTIQSHSFNGHQTIRDKVDLVVKSKFGGVMIWELGQDVDPKEEKSLLNNLHQHVMNKGNNAREQKLENHEGKGEL